MRVMINAGPNSHIFVRKCSLSLASCLSSQCFQHRYWLSFGLTHNYSSVKHLFICECGFWVAVSNTCSIVNLLSHKLLCIISEPRQCREVSLNLVVSRRTRRCQRRDDSYWPPIVKQQIKASKAEAMKEKIFTAIAKLEIQLEAAYLHMDALCTILEAIFITVRFTHQRLHV